MNQRTITYQFDRADLDAFCGALNENEGAGQIDRAFSYLTTWALDRYPAAALSLDVGGANSAPTITAVYRNADNSVGYVIGGVWNAIDRRFGFHS